MTKVVLVAVLFTGGVGSIGLLLDWSIAVFVGLMALLGWLEHRYL